jgi:hypothetical protein
MKKKQITLSKKIGEIKKLKKLFQKVCILLNDPVEMKDKALSNKAFKQACDIVQERMLNRSKQCIGPGSRPLLHRDPLHTPERRLQAEDEQLRMAESIYRRKDQNYAKAVDQRHAEITNLLTEIENCYYFLQDTFKTCPFVKGTLLEGNFEYFRKYYKSINKQCFVSEITGVLEKLNNIQYALERELQPETNRKQEAVILTEDQIELLNWFNDIFPESNFITKYSKRSTKTNYKNAHVLEQHGFIRRPEGKTKGYVITNSGREYINQYYP